MKHLTVGIVDFEIGNHASIVHCLREIGLRVRVSSDMDVLDKTDLLILPGVGAFPAAMEALHRHGLTSYIQRKAKEQYPIIGICLGMQLLTSSSLEMEATTGLDIIPGKIVPLTGMKWHIGWNTLDCVKQDPIFQPSDGESFYFNHSYRYEGPSEFHVTLSRHEQIFPTAIRHGSAVGLQFHPEKSQKAGRLLLGNLINGLVNA
jgi:imidazole glycerol-phosphate synthase subunit HisH